METPHSQSGKDAFLHLHNVKQMLVEYVRDRAMGLAKYVDTDDIVFVMGDAWCFVPWMHVRSVGIREMR